MTGVVARIGLRTRLALSLSAIAVGSVVISAMLANAGLNRQLNQYARARLHTAAQHTAQLAAGLLRAQRRWTPATVTELGHLAEMNGYGLTIYNAGGRELTSTPPVNGPRASALVRFSGRAIGRVTVIPMAGQLLTGIDRDLHRRLESLHLVAGGIALLAGLLAAILAAHELARPLKRLTVAARRMQGGEPGVRVSPGGARTPPEVRELAGAFNRLSEALEHLERIRRDAAADVAHELRTPLAGIVSRIEAAQDGVLPDTHANLAAMHAEALRMTRLVEDLGKLAEAQQPGVTLSKERLDLRQLVEERVSGYRDQMRAKGIELEQRLGAASVYGEGGRLVQIVDNLPSNALRYTDSGGSVTVELSEQAGEALLEVADTGIGIAGEDLPYIFERFWRGERSRARMTGGAGIGLAIVAELVRAHGGRIDVSSHPGEGSRFSLTLPTGPPAT